MFCHKGSVSKIPIRSRNASHEFRSHSNVLLMKFRFRKVFEFCYKGSVSQIPIRSRNGSPEICIDRNIPMVKFRFRKVFESFAIKDPFHKSLFNQEMAFLRCSIDNTSTRWMSSTNFNYKTRIPTVIFKKPVPYSPVVSGSFTPRTVNIGSGLKAL